MKLAQLGQRQSKQPSQLVLLSVFFRTWRGNWECNTGRSSLYDLFESGRLLVRREVRALQKNRPNDTAIKPGVRSRVERNKQSVRKEKNLKKEKRKDGNGNLSMNRFWFWPLWLLKKPPQVLHWHLAVGGTLGDPQSFPGRKKRPPSLSTVFWNWFTPLFSFWPFQVEKQKDHPSMISFLYEGRKHPRPALPVTSSLFFSRLVSPPPLLITLIGFTLFIGLYLDYNRVSPYFTRFYQLFFFLATKTYTTAQKQWNGKGKYCRISFIFNNINSID